MTEERDGNFRDMPTFNEQGIEIEWGAFRGLAVPAETDPEVQKKLAAAFEGIINDEDNAQAMAKAGYPITYRSPEEFRAYVLTVAESLEKVMPSLTE